MDGGITPDQARRLSVQAAHAIAVAQPAGALIRTPELGRRLTATRACAIQLTAMSAGEVRAYPDPATAAAKRTECWPPSQLDAG